MMNFINKLVAWFNETMMLSGEEMVFIEMCNLN